MRQLSPVLRFFLFLVRIPKLGDHTLGREDLLNTASSRHISSWFIIQLARLCDYFFDFA